MKILEQIEYMQLSKILNHKAYIYLANIQAQFVPEILVE